MQLFYCFQAVVAAIGVLWTAYGIKIKNERYVIEGAWLLVMTAFATAFWPAGAP